MNEPWEDSLIIALRDAQWMRLMRENAANEKNPGHNKHSPGLFLKFDGNPEQNLGDLAVGIGDLFYLFEAKSGRSKLNTEWKITEKNEIRQKRVFNTLQQLANEWMSQPHDQLLIEKIGWSLSCHHFLYWSELVFSHEDHFRNLHVEPYLLGCSAKSAPGVPESLSSFIVAEQLPGKNKYAIHRQRSKDMRRECLPLLAVLDARGAIAFRGTEPGNAANYCCRMGLPLESFKSYLRFLIKSWSEDDESLNALICSDTGYVRRLTKFSDLKHVLEPTPRSRPRRYAVQRDVLDFTPQASALSATRRPSPLR